MVAKPLCPLYKNIIKPLDRARYPELRYEFELTQGEWTMVTPPATKVTNTRSQVLLTVGMRF